MATDSQKFDAGVYRMHHQLSAVLATYAAIRFASCLQLPSRSLKELRLCMAHVLGTEGRLPYRRMKSLVAETAIEVYEAIDYLEFDREDGCHVIKLLRDAGDAIRLAQHADLAG